MVVCVVLGSFALAHYPCAGHGGVDAVCGVVEDCGREMIDYVGAAFHAACEAAMGDEGERIAQKLVDRVNGTIEQIWRHYPPDLYVTHYHKEELLEELRGIDDSHWGSFPSAAELDAGVVTDQRWEDFVDRYKGLKVTVLNSILSTLASRSRRLRMTGGEITPRRTSNMPTKMRPIASTWWLSLSPLFS